MASIKLKFRPSSVKGKKGVLSYQIIHYRLTRLIKTSYRIMPSEWDDSTGSLLISTQSECKARLLLIRDQTVSIRPRACFSRKHSASCVFLSKL